MTARTKGELADAVAQARAAFLVAGGHDERGDATVGTVVTQWLEQYRPNASSTHYNRRQAVQGWIYGSELAQVRIGRLRASHVQAWVDDLAGQLRPASVRSVYAALSLALRWARRDAVLQGIVLPASSASRWVVWDTGQVKRFLDATWFHERSGFWFISVLVGPRMGELLGLRWSDVSASFGSIRLASTMRRTRDGVWEVSSGLKQGRERVVRLPELCVAALRRQPRLSDEWVFPQPSTWTSPGWWIQELHWITDMAGLPRCRVHDLRHMAATHALRAGVPVTQVAHMLGHANAAITLRVYGHVLAEMEAEAAARIDSLYATGTQALVLDGQAVNLG